MSICSSNITKDSTPLKMCQIKNPTEIEDIDLIGALSSIIEDTIKRNKDKKKFSKKTVFFCEDSKIPNISLYNYNLFLPQFKFFFYFIIFNFNKSFIGLHQRSII